jgi:hypothetical protein
MISDDTYLEESEKVKDRRKSTRLEVARIFNESIKKVSVKSKDIKT